MGVKIYKNSIRPFIEYYSNVSEPIVGFSDNGGGQYTIQVGSTKYLSDGDDVRINNATYAVTGVIEDVSFEITASGAGLTFTGNASYQPYQDFNLPELSRSL